MIMQCYYVENIQDFKIIKITQHHSYKLIDHTSLHYLPKMTPFMNPSSKLSKN